MPIRRAAALAVLLLVAGCGTAPSPTPRVATAGPTPGPTAPPADLARERIDGRLLFSSQTDDGADDLFLADLAAATPVATRLTTDPVREFDPDLSPDGERIAYRVNPDPDSDAADIWVANADGSAGTNLTGDPGQNNWSPAWSPDGTRIAFASSRDAGQLRIFTMAPEGTDVRPVTREHGEYPDWSPDGERIVYAAAATGSTGRYELWTIDAEGRGEPERLTQTPGTEFAPAWSPDGEWIAFQAEVGSRWELWVIRPDGTDAHRVSPDEEDGVWPAWSADGLLVWSGNQGLTFADVVANQRRSLDPPRPGTDFLSWGS
jgi:Tol biopolymer transport system component